MTEIDILASFITFRLDLERKCQPFGPKNIDIAF